MKLRRIATFFAAPLALHLAALSAPAMAQASAPSRYEQAMLAGFDAATRAEVRRRATGGNSVIEVVSTILLNNYQLAGPRNPGEALSVIAVDFARGVAIIRRAANVFEIVPFDTRTLRVRP